MADDARQQIMAALLSYTRGIDRLDPDTVAAAFHAGATLDYGGGPITIEEFAPGVVGRLRERWDATQHRISNTTIERHDDRAVVETYVLAYHARTDGDGNRFLDTFNGRYLDVFERRDGRWLIASRVLRHDWSNQEPLGPPMDGDFEDSGRDRGDVLYELLG